MFTHDSSGAPDTRQRVLAAARKVMDERGIARVRVDAVAREAGLSAGALYRHFAGRQELILEVILDSLPAVRGLAEGPTPDAASDVALTELVHEVYQHEKRMAAIAVTVLADETLHAQFHQAMTQASGGPQDFTLLLRQALDRYQQAGQLRADVHTGSAAAAIQARSFHHAVLDRLFGSAAESPAEFVRTLVAELIP